MQEDLKTMNGPGMIETKFDPKKFEETMAKYYGGVWEVSAQHAGSAAAVKEIHELAKKTGHAL